MPGREALSHLPSKNALPLGEVAEHKDLRERIQDDAARLLTIDQRASDGTLTATQAETERKNVALGVARFYRADTVVGAINANGTAAVDAVIKKEASATLRGEKENCQKVLDHLGMATTLMVENSPRLSSVVDAALKADDVDTILPASLKGLGERVFQNVLEEPVKSILTDLDKGEGRKRLPDSLRKNIMPKYMAKAIEDLNGVDTMGMSPKQISQIDRAIAYLSYDYATLTDTVRAEDKGSLEGVEKKMQEFLDFQAAQVAVNATKEAAEAAVRSREQAEEKRRAENETKEILQTELRYFRSMWDEPFTDTATNPGQETYTRWQKGMDPKDLAAYKLTMNSSWAAWKYPDFASTLEEGAHLELTDGVLDRFLEMPYFRKTFEIVLDKYFDPTLGPVDKAGKRRIVRAKLKTGDTLKDFNDLDQMRRNIAAEIMGDRRYASLNWESDMEHKSVDEIRSLMDLTLQMGMAMGMMRSWHLFNSGCEDPDTKNKTGNLTSQSWNTFHPYHKMEGKILNKFTGKKETDAWLGNVGMWIEDMAVAAKHGDRESKKIMDSVVGGAGREILVVPETLALSYFEISNVTIAENYIVHEDGRVINNDRIDVPLLHALWKGSDVIIEDMSRNGYVIDAMDPWGAATKAFTLFKGGDKTALMWGKGEGKWVSDVRDSVKHLSKLGLPEFSVEKTQNWRGKHSPRAEMVAFMMMGSSPEGVYNSPELVLKQGSDGYGVDVFMRGLMNNDNMSFVLDKEDKLWIMDLFHCHQALNGNGDHEGNKRKRIKIHENSVKRGIKR